ncbi:hypothetical protein [Gemella cuniculi]|uniref:hypothetical protein n=1 Tax=Gemella cuniculi TaxID=150240 RepID=UPI000405FB13|nr:hypothetical protein [Gemella cuniculi]
MNSLQQSLVQLLEKLENKNILKKEKINLDKFKTEELAKYIQKRFKIEYPEIEVHRLLEKVHYANTYEDETLKEVAFLVDEISEYMFKLEIANRDFVVGYFNTLIIDPTIEPTEYNFVLMEINSLIENSFVEILKED